MHLRQNVSLKTYNTFGIDATAEYFIEIHETGELPAISTEKNLPATRHIIGGGSNILLTKSLKGLTIINKTKGIRFINEDKEYAYLEVASGENWHEFVMYVIANNWGGVENLALIPGTVGAAPIQNIGAYGAEAGEVIDTVNCWNWNEQILIPYSNSECRFGYRDSIYKHSLKDKVFITSVVFKLRKNPVYNVSYGTISHELEKMKVNQLSLQAIAQAVISIRTDKLPDSKKIGNAGSFFKNPTISKSRFEVLQLSYPSIPFYILDAELVKIPAGWLIEQCGWKGYKAGDAGVHEKQSLVLVNYGDATGTEIWNLSEQILQSVENQFGIKLEREVQIW